ncbi:MAG: carboxypeptidase regulatory-like domain-containing protein [Kofleriaceae bacterium]
MRRNVAIGVVVVLLLALVVWWKFLRGGDDSSAMTGGGTTAGSGGSVIGGAKTGGAKAAATKVTLSGRVTRKDGSGVAGAIISISKQATIEAMFARMRGNDEAPLATADEDGRWKLVDIPAGTYTLGATGPALLPGQRILTVGTTRTAIDGIDFVLDGGGAIASGTVSDVLGGPIPGAKVQARRSRNTMFGNDADFATFTDDKGMYQLALPPDDFIFVAAHEAYTPATRFLEMTNESVVVDFTLTPGATIRGMVVTTNGTPVPNANVAASPGGGPNINFASFAAGDVTDPAGEFTLKSLSPGALSVSAVGGGYSTVTPVVVEVGIGEQVDGVRVVVEKGFSISGRVVEKGTTKGIPGIRVGVFSIAESQAGMGREPSGEDGSFVVEGLRPAPYMVFAIGDGVMPEVGKSVELVDKDVKDVVVEMATGVTVTGVVQPGTVASIAITPTMVGLGNMFELAKSVFVRADSDETGAFTLKHVPPGSFTLSAETKDGHKGETLIVIENVDKSGVVVKLDERASIAGRVIDSTGKAVDDVEVHASEKQDKDRTGGFNFRMGGGGGNSVRTRKDGSFKIVGLDPGKHEIRVTDGRGRVAWASPANKDKPTQPIELEVREGIEITDLTLTVETRDGSIKGTVVMPDGKPAPDTWITISKDRPKRTDKDDKKEDFDPDEMRGQWRGSGYAPVITSADGRFSIEKLRRGSYKIVGENAKGSARGAKEGVKTGETITLQLGRLGTLTGKVTVDGKPVSPYDIDCDPVVREGWRSHEKRVTDKSGAYTLERLPPAEYSCDVTADAGKATAKITVPAGDVTLDIALVPWAQITGTVVSVLSGEPVVGVKLIASATGGGGDRQAFTDLLGGKGPTSDARGAFVVPRVAPGAGELVVMPATGGFQVLAKQKYDVKAGQKLDLGAIKVVPQRTGDAGTLGIGTDIEDDKLTVADVKEGGPGAGAGVQVGDRIVTINGVDVATLTPPVAQALIGSGNMSVGQTFALGVERAGAIQQVTVVSVKW